MFMKLIPMNQICLLGRIEKSKEGLSEGVLNSHLSAFRLLVDKNMFEFCGAYRLLRS